MSSLKRVNFYANLYKIFGVGQSTLANCYKRFGININRRPKNIKRTQKLKFYKVLRKKLLGKPLQKYIKHSINRYYKLRSCRGIRHHYNYPVRGQRTRTNAKTKRKLSKFK